VNKVIVGRATTSGSQIVDHLERAAIIDWPILVSLDCAWLSHPGRAHDHFETSFNVLFWTNYDAVVASKAKTSRSVSAPLHRASI
jgi:hypothetical protein